MNLAKGQRWRCNSPKCLIEIIELQSYGCAFCRILESWDSAYRVDQNMSFGSFPTEDKKTENDYWEYLIGQDKPCCAN